MVADSTERSEVELLRQVAAGDRDAFSALYDRFAHYLFSLVLHIVRDAAEAEDVVQETFVQIWEKAGDYDPRLGKPLSWAIALARNRAIDRLRASQRHSRLLEAREPPAATENGAAPAQLMKNEAAALVRAAMAGLSGEQRRAIELAFYRGLSQSEIAAELNQPLGTIKARIRRGMLQLRDTLEKVM